MLTDLDHFGLDEEDECMRGSKLDWEDVFILKLLAKLTNPVIQFWNEATDQFTIPNTISNLATWIWVNISSGNGLLPDGTKPLPKPMLTNPVLFTISGQFHKTYLGHQSLKLPRNLFI